MKLTILSENTILCGDPYRGEAGLSILLESEGKTILFDTGFSGLLLENARKMGLDPTKADLIALSHGHNDHTAGLIPLAELFRTQGRRVPVLMHPEALEPRVIDGDECGFAMNLEAFQAAFAPQFSRGPVALTERLTWLGEIPRRHAFEARSCGMQNGAPDFLPDDTALVYRRDDGIVIITGCSHSGICNIIDYAAEYTGENRILDIVGGFHLPHPPRDQLDGVCAFLREKRPAAIHPCHCTGLAAKIALAAAAPLGETAVGSVLLY